MVPEEAPEEDPEGAPTAVTEGGALAATSGYFERVSQLQAQRTTTAR